MLSDEKHCELLVNQIRDRLTLMFEAFKLFVQLFSAIVGGSIFLKLQFSERVPKSFATLADGVATLAVLVSAIMLVEHLRGWYQYRKRLSEVAGIGPDGKQIIPPPTLLRSSRIEIAMLGVMFSSLGLFYAFNPLSP